MVPFFTASVAENSHDLSGKWFTELFSVQRADSLDDLTRQFTQKAEAKGASAMTIISTGGTKQVSGRSGGLRIKC